MDIQDLINQKRAMLELARKKVAELEHQIETLLSMVKSDDFDLMLANKVKATETPSPKELMQLEAGTLFSPRASATLTVTPKGRNPKGSIKAILLEIFADGQEHHLDELEDRLNTKAPSPVKRSALRSTLMYMKNDGEISSRKSGVFRLAQKGESPGATGLSGATELPGSN